MLGFSDCHDMFSEGYMHRRELIILGSAAVVWPLGAWAQKDTKPAYIGFISGLDKAGAAAFIDAFRDGLAVRGYVEPSTLKIDTFFAESALDRIPAFVEELERRHPLYRPQRGSRVQA